MRNQTTEREAQGSCTLTCAFPCIGGGEGDKHAGESENDGNTRYAMLHTNNSVILIPALQRDLRLGVAADDGRAPIVDPSSLPLSFILDAFWRIGDGKGPASRQIAPLRRSCSAARKSLAASQTTPAAGRERGAHGVYGDRLSQAGQISILQAGPGPFKNPKWGYERVGRLWKEPVGGGAFAVVTRLIHRPRASSRFRGQEMPPKHRSGGGGLLLSHKTEASDRSSDEDGEITS